MKKEDQYYDVKRHWLVRLGNFLRWRGTPPVHWRLTYCTVCGGEIRTCDTGYMHAKLTHTSCLQALDARVAARQKKRQQLRARFNMMAKAVRRELLEARQVTCRTAPAIRDKDRHEAAELALWLLKDNQEHPEWTTRLDAFRKLTQSLAEPQDLPPMTEMGLHEQLDHARQQGFDQAMRDLPMLQLPDGGECKIHVSAEKTAPEAGMCGQTILTLSLADDDPFIERVRKLEAAAERLSAMELGVERVRRELTSLQRNYLGAARGAVDEVMAIVNQHLPVSL